MTESTAQSSRQTPGHVGAEPAFGLDMEVLQSSLLANQQEKMRFLAANQEAHWSLLVDGLQSLAVSQQKLAERIEVSDRWAHEHYEKIQRQFVDMTNKLALTCTEVRQIQSSTLDAIEDIEGDLVAVNKQVEVIANALKFGNRVRKQALKSVPSWDDDEERGSLEAKLDRGLAMLQRRWRAWRQKLRCSQTKHIKRSGSRSELRLSSEQADLAHPAGEAANRDPRLPPSPPHVRSGESSKSLSQCATGSSPRRLLPKAKASESMIANLSEMMDDGTTTAKLVQLEQMMKRRMDMLEQRSIELLKKQTDVARALEIIQGDTQGDTQDNTLGDTHEYTRGDIEGNTQGNPDGDTQGGTQMSTEEQMNGITHIVIPIATKTVQDVLSVELAKNFEGGASTLELRRDLNAVTRFADELQTRCEKAILESDAIRAIARKTRAEEGTARLQCVAVLYSMRDAVAARRTAIVNENDESGFEREAASFFRYVEYVSNAALDEMANLSTDFGGDEEIDPLTPSTLLILRVFASVLDVGLGLPQLKEIPFLQQHADYHAVKIAGRAECDLTGIDDVPRMWHDALKLGLLGVTGLLDRHSSPTLTLLDVVRLRAEFNCLPKVPMEEGERSRFALEGNDISWTAEDQWRLSERTSEILRGSGVNPCAHPGDLSKCLRSIQGKVSEQNAELMIARAMAKDSQRRALSLDSAIEELVAQMQQGFASRGDLVAVERSLGQLGERLRSAKSDLESQRANTKEYADHLAALSEQLREAASRTPDYSRIDSLLSRKADVDAIQGLLEDVNALHVLQQQSNQSSTENGAFVTKCLACNRPFGVNQAMIRPNMPPILPPGALATPGARVPSILPPSGGGVAPENMGSVEMRPLHREEQQTGVLPEVASGPRNKSPPKKAMSLQMQYDGVHDSNLVIARAGATGRLMPISSKKCEHRLSQLSKIQPTIVPAANSSE